MALAPQPALAIAGGGGKHHEKTACWSGNIDRGRIDVAKSRSAERGRTREKLLLQFDQVAKEPGVVERTIRLF